MGAARVWVVPPGTAGPGGPVQPQLEVAPPLLGHCLELGRSLKPHPFPPLPHWSQSSGLRISLFQRHDQVLNEGLPDELLL